MQTATSPLIILGLDSSVATKIELEDVVRFTKVWNSLAGRTTTKPEDLHVIFVTLLGLSPREILALPETKRMKAILKAYTKLPLPLLYEEGPRFMPNSLSSPRSWVINTPGNCSHLDLSYGIMSHGPAGNLILRTGVFNAYNPVFDSYNLVGFLINEPLPQLFWLSDKATKTHV
jgi:hypothetical protein